MPFIPYLFINLIIFEPDRTLNWMIYELHLDIIQQLISLEKLSLQYKILPLAKYSVTTPNVFEIIKKETVLVSNSFIFNAMLTITFRQIPNSCDIYWLCIDSEKFLFILFSSVYNISFSAKFVSLLHNGLARCRKRTVYTTFHSIKFWNV